MIEKINKIMKVILLIFIIMDLLFCLAGLQRKLNPERKNYISFEEISDVEKQKMEQSLSYPQTEMYIQ